MSSPEIPSTSAQALAKADRPGWIPLAVSTPKEKPAYRIRFRPAPFSTWPWRVERRSTFLWVFPSWIDTGGFSSSQLAIEEVADLAAKDWRAKQCLETNKKILFFDDKGKPIE